MYSHNRIIAEWYQRLPGRDVFHMEKKLLEQVLDGSTGRCFLHWANEDRYDLQSQVDFQQHIYLSMQHDFPLFIRGLQVDPRALPFLTESVDVALFPHVLEFVPDPFILLKETNRILRPGGYLLILSFNPASLWALGKLSHKRKQFPWNGRWISALYLRCYLARQGYTIVQYKTDFFRPPFKSQSKLERYSPLETVGALCWPFLGAVYVMVAQKVREDMVLIQSKPYAQTSALGIRGGQPEPTPLERPRACHQ